MKVLITGLSGYIGFHLAYKFQSEGHDVVGVYNSAGEAVIRELQKCIHGVTLVQHNLLESPLTLQGFDCVVHCAGLKGKRGEDVYVDNITMMLNAMKVDTPHFVFVSSGIANEGTSPYAKSKIVCESILQECASFKTTILRFFNPIGTINKMFIDKGNILHSLLESKLHEKPFAMLGNSVRDYIDIVDACDMAYQSIVSGEGYCEVGTGIGTSTEEFVKMFDEDMPLVRHESRPHDMHSSIASCKTATHHTIDDTITRYVKLLTIR